MKPIPAIDEEGSFLRVCLREAANNRVFYLLTLCDDFAVILEDDGISFRVRLDDIIDLPAVRKRVERARAKREMRAVSMAGLGVTDKPSFAEALGKELVAASSGTPPPITWYAILRTVARARAASGE